MIGGIVVSVIAGISLIFFGSFICYRRRRKSRNSSDADGEAKISKRTTTHPYGTGPVTPHTPSLPRLPPPSPPASLMVSVSPPEDSDLSSDNNFTLLNEGSKTRLVSYAGTHRGSALESVAGHSEFGYSEGEVGRESTGLGLSPLDPPVMTFGEDSSSWDSEQALQSSRPLSSSRISDDDHGHRTSLPLRNNSRNARTRTEPSSDSPPDDYEDVPPPAYDQAVGLSRHPASAPMSASPKPPRLR